MDSARPFATGTAGQTSLTAGISFTFAKRTFNAETVAATPNGERSDGVTHRLPPEYRDIHHRPPTGEGAL